MKQVWIPRAGRAEVLEVREAPDPTPGPGEVRVAVRAAGVNFADVVARQGLYLDAPKFPFVPGYEVSGTVDALGPGVTAPAVGTPVIALTRFGGYSTRVCVPARQAVPLPAGVDLLAGAAIPVTFLTAWHSLVVLGNLRPGERVLVHAAAGGVGLSALQIAKLRGAGLVAGTAGPSKHERLRALGLDAPIDYYKQDFEAEVKRLTDGKGVHVVLDAVGGRSFQRSYDALAPGGRLVMFGASTITSGPKRNLWSVAKGLFGMPKFKPVDLMMANKGVFGVNMLHMADDEPDLIVDELGAILGHVAAGALKPVVDLVVPLAGAAEAHKRLESHGNFGKVLLDMADPSAPAGAPAGA